MSNPSKILILITNLTPIQQDYMKNIVGIYLRKLIRVLQIIQSSPENVLRRFMPSRYMNRQ